MTARSLVWLLAAVVLAGCAGAGGGTIGPSAAASGTDQPSGVAPSPSGRPRIYPYVFPYPESELKSKWRYASTAWDGETRIDHGNGSTDWVKTNDGDLFAFGDETNGTAADIQSKTAAQATEWHGCDPEPLEEAAIPGGGEPGILAIHDCNGERVIRWFAVHDGFGLRVMLIVASGGDLAIARSHFEAGIAGLTWLD
jgi:hypothetical protein